MISKLDLTPKPLIPYREQLLDGSRRNHQINHQRHALCDGNTLFPDCASTKRPTVIMSHYACFSQIVRNFIRGLQRSADLAHELRACACVMMSASASTNLGDAFVLDL